MLQKRRYLNNTMFPKPSPEAQAILLALLFAQKIFRNKPDFGQSALAIQAKTSNFPAFKKNENPINKR